MKILWITHRRESDMSSTSRRGISMALKAQGCDVKFMSPDGDYPVVRSNQLGKGHRSFSRSVAAKLSSMDLQLFSVAIVEWTGVEGAYNALESAEVPWVIMDRSPPVSRGIVGYFQRRQYANAWDLAREKSVGRVVKSAHMADSQSWNGLSAIVPAGVDVDAFETAMMNESPIVVCHGSLDRSRELHRLTKMDVDLLLFGKGNDSQRLSKLTAVGDVGDVAEKLASADVGVLHLPNREVWKHASPLKVAEYAAAGLPVVASEVSGLERYRDEDWIQLIPLGDDAACKSALQKICQLSVEERKRLGTMARAEAERSMTWTHCTGSLYSMLLEVTR